MGVYGNPMDIHETVQVKRALQHINHDPTTLKQLLSGNSHNPEHIRIERKLHKKKGDILALLDAAVDLDDDNDDDDGEEENTADAAVASANATDANGEDAAVTDVVDAETPFDTQDTNMLMTQDIPGPQSNHVRIHSDSTGMNGFDDAFFEQNAHLPYGCQDSESGTIDEYVVALKDPPLPPISVHISATSRRNSCMARRSSSLSEPFPFAMTEVQSQDMDTDRLQQQLTAVAERAREQREDETNENGNGNLKHNDYDHEHDDESSNGSDPVAISDMLCGALENTSAETSRATVKANKRSFTDAFQPMAVTNPPVEIITSTPLGRVVPKAVKRNKRRPKSLVAASPGNVSTETALHSNVSLSRQRRSSDMEHMQRWRTTRAFFQQIWNQRHEKEIHVSFTASDTIV